MEKIKFSYDEENSLEIVRGFVLEMLRTQKWEQMPRDTSMFRQMVEFVGNDSLARKKFLNLVNEVIWELIIQRVLNPGIDTGNPDLPFFRITDYGRKVLEAKEFLPYDPTNYLNKYSEIVTSPDSVAFAYLKESLRCFNSGSYLASVMMLGISSERVFLGLCEVLLDALTDIMEKKRFESILNGISMIAKFDFVRKKIEYIRTQKGNNFPKIQLTNLLGIFEFIRIQRNDIGHPQDDLRIPERDEVYVNLRLFPQYCKTIEEVMRYLIGNKV
jgi:hypothetical protein